MQKLESIKSFVRLGALQSSTESEQDELDVKVFDSVLNRFWDGFLNLDAMEDYEGPEQYLQEYGYSRSQELLLLLERLEEIGYNPPYVDQFFDFAQKIFRSKVAFTLFMRLPLESSRTVYSTVRLFKYTTESLEDYLLTLYSTADKEHHSNQEDMCSDDCLNLFSHAKDDSIFKGYFEELTKFVSTQRSNVHVINAGKKIIPSLARFHGVEKFMEFVKVAENETFEGSSMDIHRILSNWEESKKYPLNWSAHMIPHEEVDLWRFSDVNDYGKDWMDNLR